jgi:hypothetical protein
MASRIDELGAAFSTPREFPVVRWFLLTGGRFTVTLALMSTVFAVLIGLSVLWPVGVHDILDETSAARALFNSLLSGAILLVSIVVSINSIVLSHEITDLESQERRIDASLKYHREIEAFIEADVTPARPADFLTAVLFGVSRKMDRLTELTAEADSDEFESDVAVVADRVAADIERVRETLADANFGTFPVLLAGLNYNYSGQLHAIRGLRYKFEGDLSDAERAVIDDLVDIYKHLGTGREYFKSLYYKRELAHLSSRLLLISLPVVVFTSYVILALDAQAFPDVAVFGLSALSVSLLFAYTVALAPYLVLTAYVLRVATITLRTLAAGPFILQKGSSIDSVEWATPDPSRDWEFTDRIDDE